jgi:hypothetical protein
MGQWEHWQKSCAKTQLRLIWTSEEDILLKGVIEEPLAAASP